MTIYNVGISVVDWSGRKVKFMLGNQKSGNEKIKKERTSMLSMNSTVACIFYCVRVFIKAEN